LIRNRAGQLAGAAAALLIAVASGAQAPGAPAEYRTPPAPVARLLSAPRPPDPLLHGASARVALLTRQPLVSLKRLSRPTLGLAGYLFDPESGTSERGPLIERVEVLTVSGAPNPSVVVWQPGDGALLDHVEFSPDGSHLSATRIAGGSARLVVFDIGAGSERVLETPIQAAWGRPCWWTQPDALLCRVVPSERAELLPVPPGPRVLEHRSGPIPTRTYSNLLEDQRDEALFAHYFDSELARVDLTGAVHRLPGSRGLLAKVRPSPNGELAVVTRVVPPFLHLVPARRFPQIDEVWDLVAGRKLRTLRAPATQELERMSPVAYRWNPAEAGMLGWTEKTEDAGEKRVHRWLVLQAPFSGEPREIARSQRAIDDFDWTTAGSAYFISKTERGTRVHIHLVTEDGPREIWTGAAEDQYGNPGHALGVDGARGSALEIDGKLFLAGDGLGPDGPEPFLDAFDLATSKTEQLFASPKGAYEPVLGILDLDPPALVTSRESETEPPQIYVIQGSERRLLHAQPNPFPELDGVERRLVDYQRKDGTALQATLYLPASRAEGVPLPTLVWIYPYEYSDRAFAEQREVRRFRFHKVKGPSPLIAPLAGYALLLSPTMPIIGEPGRFNDEYVPQLVVNAEAAVSFLVESGISDPERIAVGGRSYGAFSAANLLVYTRLFRSGIAMSGAYNRTLTPFGFQHESRSFWKETALYAEISPFFHADQIEAPLLLVHGGEDPNAGTPPEQARRFFHALVGNGVPVRYVELPHEGHHYLARESVFHVASELLDWLEGTLGPPPAATSSDAVAPKG